MGDAMDVGELVPGKGSLCLLGSRVTWGMDAHDGATCKSYFATNHFRHGHRPAAAR